MDLRSAAMMFAGFYNGRPRNCRDGAVHADHNSEVRMPGGSALGS
jgi:hypothetical protein